MTRLLVLTVGVGALTAATAARAAVVQNGEIVIIEGSAATVAGSAGAYSIDPGNIDAIAQEFYAAFPDEFDELMIFTTFVDQANGGAYFTSPPSGSAKLIGFVNMNQIGFWGTGAAPLSVIGQEVTHAWMMFETFVDPTSGQVSDELIGRMGAHWSSLVDADGSVCDGVDWVDNGDGTFTAQSIMTKLGNVDLYVMGYLDASEVPPFFMLRNAVGPAGPATSVGIWDGTVSQGTTVTATKVMVTVQDIINASGSLPPIDMRQKDFRIPFIIVTAPGETAAGVSEMVAQLDETRLLWNEAFQEWTLNRGTMCTDTSAPCDIPRAAFAGGRVTEGTPSDGDGVVEPGEHANVEIDWSNTGNAPAAGAIASLTVLDDTTITPPAPVTIPDIAVAGMQTTVFDVALPNSLQCGVEYTFRATAALNMRTWNGQVNAIPGIIEGAVESFAASDGGWLGNVDGTDTVAEDNAGAWDYGPAEVASKDGIIFQPEGGRSGPTDSAWWTGRKKGFDVNANDVDSGKTTLTTAAYDLKGKVDPVLRFYLWYQAWTLNTTPPMATTGDDLIIEVSTDDGLTWGAMPLHVVKTEEGPRIWERVEIPLAGKIPAGAESVRFRFTAQDVPPVQNLVEVGIDDVSIWSLSTSCSGGGGGCGCDVGGRDHLPGRGGLAAVGLLGLLGFLTARRRR